MKLKTIIVLSVIPIFLLSCHKEIANTVTSDVKKDSSYYFERWGKNIEYLPLPADTFRIEFPIDCPDQEVKVIDNKKTAAIQIKDKKLTIAIDTKKDSLKYITSFKESKEYKESQEAKGAIKEVIIIKKTVPKWVWFSLGLNILLIGWITRRFWLRFIKFPV